MTPLRCCMSMVLLCVFAGCGSSTGPTDAGQPPSGDVAADVEAADVHQDVPEEISAPEPLDDWPDSVEIFPFLDDQTIEGNIADGAVVEMGWADEPLVSCWLFNITKYFTGSQVYYAMDKPLQKASQLTITMTPADGVDLNIYAYGLETGTFYFPPEVPETSGCIYSHQGDAGVAESISLQNLQAPLQWLIAVSGPEGVTDGAFTLTIERSDLMPGPGG